MGSINRGSFKSNKVQTRSKMNNSAYNKNSVLKFGNNKFGFKNSPKNSITEVK
jgi:hypothetical protein